MQIIDDRRALHRIPELDRRLPQTMAYLKNALSGLRCAVFAPMESALCAYFDFGAGRTIAFRSDADALPIQEETGLPFASEHPGCMHACGHDGHMAMLLELARRLDRKQKLNVNVLLVFQPAEETIGGARELCATGVFKTYGAEAIFGMHLWPDVPYGQIAGRKNEFLARSSEVTVDFTGRSSHIARAEKGIDALDAAVRFYTRVRALADALPPEIYRLIGFGRMTSGTARNAVSGRTHLEGTLRAFQDDVFDTLAAGIRRIGGEVAAETGCAVEIGMSEGYPAVWNPPELYDAVVRRCGLHVAELAAPSMITEDFSWYQRALPGLFFFLGIGPAPALHADTFQFDENILPVGASFFEQIADRY